MKLKQYKIIIFYFYGFVSTYLPTLVIQTFPKFSGLVLSFANKMVHIIDDKLMCTRDQTIRH